MIAGITQASRARLDAAIEHGALHLRPIYAAVRDAGIIFAVIPQGAGRFDLHDSRRPSIALIGDDMDQAYGPAGFHRKSLRRLLARCTSVAIVSCEPLVEVYTCMAVTAAGLRGHSALIETRLEHEENWTRFVKEHAPDAALMVATVKPAGGVH